MDIDKTRVYIERSESTPLDLSLREYWPKPYPKDAFLLVVPHFGRLKSLVINGRQGLLQNLTPHLPRPIPLLRELTVDLDNAAPLVDALFNGNLPSLRSLNLARGITHLPGTNLSKLTSFELRLSKITITQLLNFFEGAPHLRDITLYYSIPRSSNAPPERVVSPPCLKNLTINAHLHHSILLDHLSIPAGVSLILGAKFAGDCYPLLHFVPKTLGNLKNLLFITSVRLCLDQYRKFVRLDGPSGELYVLGYWMGGDDVLPLNHRIVRSLSRFNLSRVQKLAVTMYNPPTMHNTDESAPHFTLLRMEDLRALTLTQSNNLPFIAALNPDQNPSKRALCPKLEELVLYVKGLESFNIKELMSMAKGRASAGVKLWSITIISLGELMPGDTVFRLKEYVTRVNYRVEQKPPSWDGVPEVN